MQLDKKNCLNCNAVIDVISEIDENDEWQIIQGGYDVCGVCMGKAYTQEKFFKRTEFGCPECNTSLIEGYEGLLFCSNCKYKESI